MTEWTPRVADTSWIYAVYDETDPHHQEALEALAKPSPIVLPGEVATEAIGLMAHRLGRSVAKTCFEDLRRRPNVELGHETDALDAAELMPQARGSFVDAVVLWHCRRLKIPAETFDEHLRALAEA